MRTKISDCRKSLQAVRRMKGSPMMSCLRTTRTTHAFRLHTFGGRLAAMALLLAALAAPALGDCPELQVPPGNELAFHVYAVGVQIYRWNGTSWSFVGPEAVLFADAGHNAAVGTHYAGPTWER